MIELEHIRIKMIEAIHQSRLTQLEIAQKIGVVQQTVSSYLHQNRMPSLDTFANLCAALDLDANEILCLSEYKSKV